MEELIQRAAEDLINAKYAIALTGAGISTESGIKDFRGPEGIWTKHPEAELEAYQAYDKLLRDPKEHWEKILTPGSFFSLFDEVMNALPNRGHIALAELETLGILKLLITQNVDSLHEKAGSRNVIEYHGGISRLRCMSCGTRFARDEYDLERLKSEDRLPPRCTKCNGVIKHDGVYFGEAIPSDVAHASLEAASMCDLMLICGTSAVVYPFAQLPRIARQRGTGRGSRNEWGLYTADSAPKVTIIEVNADATPLTYENVSDYLIQGSTGEILPRLVDEIAKRRT